MFVPHLIKSDLAEVVFGRRYAYPMLMSTYRFSCKTIIIAGQLLPILSMIQMAGMLFEVYAAGLDWHPNVLSSVLSDARIRSVERVENRALYILGRACTNFSPNSK